MTERRHELRRYPWQVRDSGQLLLVVAAGVCLVASVAQTAAPGGTDPRIAVGLAGALAYALLIQVGDHQAQHSAPQVVTVVAIGMIVGALPHLAVGRPA